MHERGEFVPTPADAPAFDGDEAFWEMFERGLEARDEGFVQLKLDPATVDFFRSSGAGYLERMAKILNDEAKKAS
jgi:uncharacterized protein (DUF4415 family)